MRIAISFPPPMLMVAHSKPQALMAILKPLIMMAQALQAQPMPNFTDTVADGTPAIEFGGTFSLTNYQAGYVGYFGGEKQPLSAISNPASLETLTGDAGIWDDIATAGATKLHGMGFYHDSDAPLRQTFEVNIWRNC